MSELSKAKSAVHHAREVRQERAIEFWQNTIRLGRVQEQTDQAQQNPAVEPKPKQQ